MASSSESRYSLKAKIAATALGLLVVLAVVGEVVVRRAGPMLKGKVVKELSEKFRGRVELDGLDASLVRGLVASGKGLRIFPPNDVVAAGAKGPLIAIENFSFYGSLTGLLRSPVRVRKVEVDGLLISIPPKEVRQAGTGSGAKAEKPKVSVVVGEIVCTNSRLVLQTAKADKDPKQFDLKRIVLYEAGSDTPWKYEATLTNAVPRGEIAANGTFGPWEVESPGDSPLTGEYRFEHADLNTIKGIGGMLSSSGSFKGLLNRIEVDGTTDTPDFSLDTAKHPVPLHTAFHALVDGTSGDTYLKPVTAELGKSHFSTAGSVVNIKGQGHRIELDINVPGGRLEDFLQLAVKTEPPLMKGVVSTKAKLVLPPGPAGVPQRMKLTGKFGLQGIRFSSSKVQDTVDMLSLRAQGEPERAKPGAKDVSTQMDGSFQMADGLLRFSELAYRLPGARVNLSGVYSLDGREFDFHGKVFTEATLPQMVESKWKSLLLRTVSPFFKKKGGGGAEIPVSISGTQSEPKFGLDLLKKH